MDSKAQGRDRALAALAHLNEQERVRYLQKIVDVVTKLPEWQKAKMVALSLAQDVELPTELLIQTALLQKKTVLLPKIKPNRQMDFIPINEQTEYQRHKFGMLEPVGTPLTQLDQIDFVLVPGLAFSKQGDRLGFGGGYYDRWLTKVPATKVGVTIFDNYFETPAWPIEPTDQKIDKILVLDDDKNENNDDMVAPI